jgi:hypothetical protein
MFARLVIAILAAGLGAAGVVSLGLLIYRPSEAHAHRLLALGMPGVLLLGLASLLLLLGGLGLALKTCRN